MSFPIPDLYYPMNICDTNLNPTKQLVNWASGTPVYDASLNSAYISTKNYQCGVGSAEFPKNEITGFGAATITSCVNQTHGIAVSQDQLKMITCNRTNAIDDQMSYATRTSITSTWSTFTPFGDTNRDVWYYRCSLTADGKRGVICSCSSLTNVIGRVYFFTWTSTTPSAPVLTLDTINRYYRGVAITPDGSKLVACADTSVFFATWDANNYTTFTQTIDTATYTIDAERCFMGICISNTGDRIVYGETGSMSGHWHISYWNGTNYDQSIVFKSSNPVTLNLPRSACFSADASILFLSYYNDMSGSIQYGTYDSLLNTYSNFKYISTTLIPADLDLHGLCYVDGITRGYLYASGVGTALMYTIPVSFAYSVVGTIGAVTKSLVTSVGLSYTGISVSKNQLRMILSSTKTTLQYSSRISTDLSWSTPAVFGTAETTIFFRCGITLDGTRGVGCSRNISGGVHVFTWPIDSSTITIYKLSNSASRDYTGVAITPDGSRIVASTPSDIYFAPWNGSSTSFTKTLQETITNILFSGISISSDGDRIVYGDINNNQSKNWYIAYWNGTNYSAGTNFYTNTAGTPRSSYFSADASILYLSYVYNVSGSIEYGTYNPATKTYDNFTYIPINKLPARLDAHGLCVVDSISGGSLYVATWGGTQISEGDTGFTAETYCLPLSYDGRPAYPVNSLTQNVTLPEFKPGDNGFTVATWFRSNYNSQYARIFEFQGSVSKKVISVFIKTKSDGTGYLTYFDNTDNEYNVDISSHLINDNTWHHIAITSAYAFPGFRASHVIIYLDGVSVSETSEMFNYFDISCTSNYIGKSNWSINPPFYGNIDDFRFYKRVLTSAQITQLYTKDSTINHFADCKNCTVYRISDYNTTLKVDVPWGLTTAMGTTTYYYWIDPYAASNAYMNRPNPIRFSYTYDNSTNLTSAKLFVMADDFAEIFINNSYIYSFGGWTIADTSFSTVPLRSGSNTFQFNCINSGGPAMLAVYVTDSIGNVLFNTNYTTSGWTAIHTGFFTKNIPLTSYINNNSSQTASTTSVASTKFMVGTNTPVDISKNGAIAGAISPYSTLGYFTATNTDLANIFYTNLK